MHHIHARCGHIKRAVFIYDILYVACDTVTLAPGAAHRIACGWTLWGRRASVCTVASASAHRHPGAHLRRDKPHTHTRRARRDTSHPTKKVDTRAWTRGHRKRNPPWPKKRKNSLVNGSLSRRSPYTAVRVITGPHTVCHHEVHGPTTTEPAASTGYCTARPW